MTVARAMTIAGSDSGGGAGIQADLKAFSALGVFGTSAITAITAQNTVAVTAALALEPGLVAAQIDAVIDDIGVDAVKTGMMANSAIVDVVVDRAARGRLPKLVVDPVLIAKSGDTLLAEEALRAVRERLTPHALAITPNHPEAEVLVGHPIEGDEAVRDAARAIVAMGARWVLMKGGHRAGAELLNLLHDGRSFHELRAPRVDTRNTHGTGCTLASAITARLALGDDVPTAVAAAHAYLQAAIAAAKARAIGRGHGPVHHFHAWY
ncbi:MAG: bifunctional hydroxymethylpyrimidine kinase/phosphomethylpyrimidine kinase [Alphaproteobacteria bacterium]|nr:bifunctional hydroxymethylpyrimidine kinase/phosphomethylpyrimidine kinase [Alphaproteobacteria bacterium]